MSDTTATQPASIIGSLLNALERLRELGAGVPRLAYSVEDVLAAVPIGKTRPHEEMREGRLRAKKLNGRIHWGIGAPNTNGNDRWECDDSTGSSTGDDYDTQHQIWIR